MSVNRVTLLGRLGHDPELEYRGESRTPFCRVRIATEHHRKDETITDWISVVLWNETAKNCARFMAKGGRMYVEGRLQVSTWEAEDGHRSRLEVIGSRVVFLDNPPSTDEDDTPETEE